MDEKANTDSPYVSVIMAGGSGTRFWPISTKQLPKQYLKLFSHRSLIQETMDRLLPLQGPEAIFISSGTSQVRLLEEQLPEVKNLILEPVARNTAPCLMLSLRELIKRGYTEDTVLGVFPADHHILHAEAFRSVLKKAITFAKTNDALVTLGIVPTSPHTGYGYIEASSTEKDLILPTKRFVEKPNSEKAKEFLQTGTFYWNCGIFIWSIRSLRKAFETYLGDDWKRLLNAPSKEEVERVFTSLKSQAIDVAILEKARNVFVLPAESLGWSDVGSWNALYELRATDAQNVSVAGKIESLDSTGCLVNVSQDKLVALVGVKNLIIVESHGRLLIMAREKDQLVRTIAEKHP